MSIYDRTRWPAPEANPLVRLFERGDHWYSNQEICVALDPERSGNRRSIIASWPTLAEQLGESDTAVRERGLLIPTNERQGSTGGVERYFSSKALIIIAMRAQTVNAAAFRDWLATEFDLDSRVGGVLDDRR